MKRLAIFAFGILFLSLCLLTQDAAAQADASACPKIMILSKNLGLVKQDVTKCENCNQATYRVKRSEFTIVIRFTTNTVCDETAPVIPNGSTLTVHVKRIVRIDNAGTCAGVERGSFYNIGSWTLNGPTGAALFAGDVYRGTVGTNPQGTNRCCNRGHEEVYIEGKGAASSTTGWYLRAMGVINEYFDLNTCKYSPNWTGKLDGVMSQE